MRGGRRRDHPGSLGLRGRAERRRRHLRLVRRARRAARLPRGGRGERGVSVHTLLTEQAAAQAVGEHGLVALDWHSGNRSVLVDHELSGVVVGQTLATRPEDTYRALLEATAFGTRRIIEAFDDVRGAGHRARRRGRAAQERAAHADLRRRHRPAAVHHRLRAGAGARGRRCTRPSPRAPTPTSAPPPRPWARGTAASTSRIRSDVAAYDELYAEYLTLHDYFGRGANDVMHRLKARRRAAAAQGGRDDAAGRGPRRRQHGCARRWRDLHGELTRNGLVDLDRGQRLGPGARPATSW